MIKVSYCESEHRMEIKGHARFAPMGEDLVCSAATMLMLTLEAMVIDHCESLMPTIHKADGEVSITCAPTKGNAKTCRVIYDTIFRGYERLEESFAEYVKTVKIKGE